MIIDWGKLTELLLPPRLRAINITELLRVLVWQITHVSDRFNIAKADTEYKMNINASTLALEKLLSTELEASVVLSELDGKPYDFLVDTDSPVDENRLKALLGAYKLAGKSYTFKLGETIYTAEWVNHVCEIDEVIYTAEWVDHVCEDDGIIEIGVAVLAAPGEDEIIVEAVANNIVTSQQTVTGYLKWYNDTGALVGTEAFYVLISVGEQGGQSTYANTNNVFTALIDNSTLALSPEQDEYYNYIITT